MKILIVDDDTGLTQLLQLVFESRGFWVTTAYDGEQALQVLENELPEVIVLDLMMPGVGGLEVCKQVREDPRTANIPIIVLSAMPNESAHQEAMDAGATEYLIKPIRPSDLIKRIREVTSREEASTVQVLM
jgi:two-component system alkaline phosphatase synthesis response regulator PhoP